MGVLGDSGKPVEILDQSNFLLKTLGSRVASSFLQMAPVLAEEKGNKQGEHPSPLVPCFEVSLTLRWQK